jgi:outer membrane immunogenic protein
VFGLQATETDSIELNWSAAIRGRVGYAFGRFLPYFAGGVAFGGVDVDAGSANPVFVGSWSDTYTGYTVGGGAEYALTDRIILRGEYRFTDFGTETFSNAAAFTAHDVDLSTHDARFGVAFKF